MNEAANDRLEIKQDGDDALLPVQAQPKSRRNAVIGIHNGRLKVAVTQAPEKGKANAALIHVIAQSLGLKRSQLAIVAGETSARKVVRITGVKAVRLKEQIARLIEHGR